jgi:multimeric flavodoxin WrbA
MINDKSASTKVCNLIKDTILTDYKENMSVDVVPLMDYDLKPCILCGACMKTGRCVQDEEFNKLLVTLENADGFFIVVPHYSPIPAKLLMVFEKINEIMYANWLNNPQYQSPLNNKPVGIIGHGGMTESKENLKYYHDNLITPVANTLKALSFRIIKLNETYPNGAPFGLKDDSCLKNVKDNIFPEIIQDWSTIEDRIKPLITNVMKVVTTGIDE